MENKQERSRALSPKQVRAVALRVQGESLTAIARKLGLHRVTVSRWFGQDGLVIAELARRLEELQEQELRRHAAIRQKAMTVVESAIDGGDVRAALAALRLPVLLWPQGPTLRERITTDPSDFDPGRVNLLDAAVSSMGWLLAVDGARELLESAEEIADEGGVLKRLLLLDQVADWVLRALRLAEGVGLTGFASLTASEQAARLAAAGSTLKEAFEAIAGPEGDDETEDGMPTWPGDELADRAIALQGRALQEMLSSLEGADQALALVASPEGAQVAGWLASAREATKQATGGSRRWTAAARVRRVTLLTESLSQLVRALGAAATLEVDQDAEAVGD